MGVCGRQADLSFLGVRVGVTRAFEWAWQIFFMSIDRLVEQNISIYFVLALKLQEPLGGL